jgi:hypothetical protein
MQKKDDTFGVLGYSSRQILQVLLFIFLAFQVDRI